MTNNPNQGIDLDQPETVRETRGQGGAPEASSAVATETGNDLQTLRQELEAARQEVADCNDRYLRSRADLENFRRRSQQTSADLAESSRKALLQKMLSIKDNLERALQYADSADGECKGIIEGVRLTQSQLDQALSQEGVKPIAAQGNPFDPRLEEAVQSVSDPGVPDHTVVQVVRQGYMYRDDVLRPAQVIVNVLNSE